MGHFPRPPRRSDNKRLVEKDCFCGLFSKESEEMLMLYDTNSSFHAKAPFCTVQLFCDGFESEPRK